MSDRLCFDCFEVDLAGLTRVWLGIILALARDYDRAIEEARIMSELEPASCWPPLVKWFDRAIEERDQNMMMFPSFPHMDPVRGDPRNAALLRKMKLV